jgi:hypothetical protein
VAAPGRRHFGSTHKLPSGRWQAGYWYDGRRHVALDTFSNKTDALAVLSTVERDRRRGSGVRPIDARCARHHRSGWQCRRFVQSPAGCAESQSECLLRRSSRAPGTAR